MLLKVKNLVVSFNTYLGKVHAVRDISFSVGEGETVAIVGESGCGKSVTAQAIMRLIATPPGIVENGSIMFEGQDMTTLSKQSMRKIRGKKIGMIFQDPMTALNPTMRCGKQLMEGLKLETAHDKNIIWDRAVSLLKQVGISEPEKRLEQYPFELSGGMRQRILIAIALACQPRILIADEPTTALDVTIQSQILELMRAFQKEMNMSIILITHDLGIVAGMCDRVIVMYAGKIVEEGDVRSIFKNPRHPYTKGLLRSIPRLDMEKNKELIPIWGAPPNLLSPPAGCAFCPRCEYAMKICKKKEPLLTRVSHQHSDQFGQAILSDAEENPERRVKLTLPRDALKVDDETDGQIDPSVGEKPGLSINKIACWLEKKGTEP